MCCSLLGSMFTQLIAQPQALQLCSSCVQPVLARISECLDIGALGSSPGSGDTRAALLALLRQLTVDGPNALHAALAESDPLPPGAADAFVDCRSDQSQMHVEGFVRLSFKHGMLCLLQMRICRMPCTSCRRAMGSPSSCCILPPGGQCTPC